MLFWTPEEAPSCHRQGVTTAKSDPGKKEDEKLLDFSDVLTASESRVDFSKPSFKTVLDDIPLKMVE